MDLKKICGRVKVLAKEVGDPALIAETEVIQGYVEMIKAIYVISESIAGKEELDPGVREVVQNAFDKLVRARRQTVSALDAWKKSVAPDCTASRIADTVNVTRQTVTDVGKALAPLGIDKTK